MRTRRKLVWVKKDMLKVRQRMEKGWGRSRLGLANAVQPLPVSPVYKPFTYRHLPRGRGWKHWQAYTPTHRRRCD